MPYKVLSDVSVPRVIAEGTDSEGKSYVETDSVVYPAGSVVHEADIAPETQDRLDEGDERLSELLEHISEEEAEELETVAAGSNIVAPEHEAEAEVLRQDGKEVMSRENITGEEEYSSEEETEEQPASSRRRSSRSKESSSTKDEESSE